MSHIFHNWSSTQFVYSWDSQQFTFAPGRVYEDTIKSDAGDILILEKGITEHFANHLAQREFDVQGINPGMLHILDDYRARGLTLPEVVEAKPDPVVEEETHAKEEVEEVAESPKKRGRPAKAAEEVAEEVVA